MRFFIISFVSVVLVFSQSAFAAVFGAETAKLDNGLEIVLIRNDRVPVVTHMLWYKTGAADEPVGQSGLTHFLEHLMFKGTPLVPSGEFSKRIAEIGGHDNAFTTHDATVYYQSVARRYLPLVMAMEADRMKNLQLTSDDIERERKVILQERSERYDNNPSGRFWEAVTSEVYEGHPYGRPVIGWKSEIEKLTPKQINDYYHARYAPNNAILVVSGDITMDELLPLAQKYYGKTEPQPGVFEKKYEILKITREKTTNVVKRDAQVHQPQWARIYPVPSYSSGTLETADALSLVADILGNDTTGLIYKYLVLKKKIAVSASMSYDGSRRGTGQFGVYVVPAPGVTPNEISEAVDDFIKNTLRTGIVSDDIDRSIERIITAADYARDSIDGPPRIIGEAMTNSVALSDIENFPERISSIRNETVNAALDKMFYGKPEEGFYRPVTAVLLPEKAKGEKK